MIALRALHHPFPLRSVWRRVHQRTNPLLYPTLHVNEYPKSGGTWLCRMLSEVLDRRFDDNRYPQFGAAVVKHHRLAFTAGAVVTVIRDPRDQAVSYFHHCRQVFAGDGFNAKGVALMARHVFHGAKDEAEALDRFVTMLTDAPMMPRFSWAQFYGHADRTRGPVVRYEDLRRDTAGTLSQFLQQLGQDADPTRIAEVAAQHDIAKILAARSDDGHHFIRKGAVGGWQGVLSAEAQHRIEQAAGPLLRQYGYAQ